MPKIVDHEARREEVAEAVRRTIARRGIQATTVREIASEAGYSTGVLSHYFRDKEELLIFVLRLASSRTMARMERAMRRSTGLAGLRGVLREALPLDDERRAEWQVWVSFWGRAVGAPELEAEQQRWYVQWCGLVRSLIAAARRAGEIRQDVDTALAADTLVALVDGLGVQAVLEPDRLPARRQMRIINGYLASLLAQRG